MSDTLDGYQHRAAETAIYPDHDDPGSWQGLAYTVLGLAGEAGELANKVKKIVRDNGGVIDRDALIGEAGDVLWYLAAFCSQLQLSLSDVAALNLAKLASRRERGTLGGSGDQR